MGKEVWDEKLLRDFCGRWSLDTHIEKYIQKLKCPANNFDFFKGKNTSNSGNIRKLRFPIFQHWD